MKANLCAKGQANVSFYYLFSVNTKQNLRIIHKERGD